MEPTVRSSTNGAEHPLSQVGSKIGPTESPDPLGRAAAQLVSVQHAAGFWEGEMVWNTMLLSQWVIVQHIVHRDGGRAVPEDRKRRILRHYEVTRLSDGSWPMHGEGAGYVFFTSLAYVALRLLGLPPDHPLVAPARAWLRAQPGGVLSVPSWGKLWLSMIGLYEYEGMNPVPPEIFLLPDALPVHPNNFYCHTRYIYLGIGYLYGRRFRADLGPITDALREELYDRPYAEIDFAAHRHDIAASDLHVRPSLPLRVAYDALLAWEHAPELVRAPLRRRALALCEARILYEVRASRRQGISPVNGLLNCLAIYAIDPQHPELQPALEAMESWRWEDEAEGLRFCGAHSTAWDTAFSIRALAAMPAPTLENDARAREAVRKGYRWLVETQQRDELPGFERERRAPIRGGWCFSDGVHRWPVSDCTAEALNAIFEAEARELVPEGERLSEAWVNEAVEFILRRQNRDGGFGSYEARRAGALLEWVNPSEMYGNCMTERSYTECTASCVGALVRWLRRGDRHGELASRVEPAVGRAVELLRARQRPDGSYLGFWGVNFTYGCFHVVEALVAAGVTRRDPAIARALTWLRAHQKPDGGWGEHWKSCLTDEYVEHVESQPAMTAWAVLALAEGDERSVPEHDATRRAIRRGRAWLERAQDADGGWPHKAQSGVFFSTAMLDYRLYKDVFPTWALARTQPRG